MRRAILRDVPTEKVHDLTALVEKEKEISLDNEVEISLGRTGYGNMIELGQDNNTVSRKHATITYSDNGIFCIRDHSTNGTKINKIIINSEKGNLRDGYELWFGSYGPVFYEEIYEKIK